MRNSRIIIIVLFLLFVLIFYQVVVFQSRDRLVITDTNLFDPMAGMMLPNRTVLVKGERIIAIGTPKRPIKVPLFTHEINGSGKYLIPGLIDAHTHLNFLLDAVDVKGEEVLPLYLGNGVTSVRDIGDHIVPQKAIADFADAHPSTCPTVFMCSPLIDGDIPYHPTVGIPLTDTAKVAAFVDSMVSHGVTTLKMYVRIDSLVFQRVIEEGHKHGLTVSAHLPSRHVSAHDAVGWGLDVIEHIWGIPDDSLLMAQMVAQGTMVDPTLVVFKNMIYTPDLPEVWQSKDHYYVPDTLRLSWDLYRSDTIKYNAENFKLRQEKMKSYKKLTGLLYQAGVTLLAGTDSPEPYCPPGFALHDELELLVESGLSPAAALKCATMNNANALNQSSNLGSIEVGKMADMVILTANPLSDIRNTRQIHRVIHRGLVCDPEDIWSSHGLP